MTLALDLTAELWPLLDLIVAIFQPAVVLLLCGGVVVASTHLFAMLGTQWGNRRVTGKALIFSLAIHFSLLFGVVALIPEYKSLAIRTAFEEDHTVELSPDPVTENKAFEETSSGNDDSDPTTDRHPWDQIATSLATPVERAEAQIPDAAPVEISPTGLRPPTAPVSIPDPVFVPLPPSAQETSELARANVPQEYNPAAFQPTMDEITRPEPAQTPSRKAPAIERTAPSLAAINNAPQLSRMQRPAQDTSIAEFRPGVDIDLPSALPSPEGVPLTTSQPEQAPQQTGAAPFQITDTAADGQPAEVLPPQSAAPEVMPSRPAPRPFPSRDGGLAKLVRPAAPGPPGTISPGGDDPGREPREQSDVGMESLPNLIRPQEMLPAQIGSSSPAQYQLRGKEQREMALQQFGGSAESEAAVDAALKWLASIQDAQGFWDGDAYGAGKIDVEGGIDREFAGRDADTGLTALSILAFLGKQHTLEQGAYSENVTKALRWLVGQQGKNSQGVDGYLGGNAAEIAGVYSHAIATFAIAEAYAMTENQEQAQFLLDPLQKAVRFTLLCQLDDGGWRYKRGQQGGGDMSIFGWHLMSLKSAQAAGLEIPLASRQKMILFLQQRGLGRSGGLASYRPNERPSVAMTAESLFCKQMLGLPREHPSCDEAVKFLLTNPPTRQSMNLYAWYYSTLALYQYGGSPWEQWNGRLRDLLIEEQVTTGEFAGSWEPRDQWGGYGGRIYSTAFATLTLEVYYRYLPLYRSTAPAAAPQEAEPTSSE